jgi:chemotaxis signal transduction protein
MSATPPTFDAAAYLRDEFDSTFAAPVAEPTTGSAYYVVLEVAGHAFAAPSSALARVLHGVPIVPVPSASPALLGIAGIRSALVPVFSLRSLLAEALSRMAAPPQPAAATSDWVILCESSGNLLGLAFDRILSYQRVAPDGVFAGPAAAAAHSAAAIRIGADLCPILDIPSLLQQLLAATAPDPLRSPLRSPLRIPVQSSQESPQ